MLSNEQVVENFERAVGVEKQSIAAVVSWLKEVDRRRLYLIRECTSSFAYLTKRLGYTPSSAQRRIDAARLMEVIPEIKEDLDSGNLNLMQIAVLSQAVRQKQTEAPDVKVSVSEKKELLEMVKEKDLKETSQIISQVLDIKIKAHEKKRVQQDGSVRAETTISKELAQMIERVKELNSHTHPGASLTDVFEFLAKDYLQRKDPNLKTVRDAKTKAAHSQKPEVVSVTKKRLVFQRDQHCQWRDPKTGKKCCSNFQLQVDHIKSVWAGGSNAIENLQLLCSIHNRWKYEREANIHRL